MRRWHLKKISKHPKKECSVTNLSSEYILRLDRKVKRSIQNCNIEIDSGLSILSIVLSRCTYYLVKSNIVINSMQDVSC